MDIEAKADLATENEIIPGAFLIYKVVGFWHPIGWPVNKILVYNFYTGIVVFLQAAAIVFELLYFILGSDNFSDALVDDICMILPAFNNVIKMFALLITRDQVIMLINTCFEERWYANRNAEEVRIRSEFHRAARRNVVIMGCLVFGCFMAFTLRMYFDDKDHVKQSRFKLPLNAWYPFSTETTVNFWMTYAYQTYTSSVISAGYIANVCLILGFMLQSCTQLKILRSRIYGLAHSIESVQCSRKTQIDRTSLEKNLIVECIRDHRCILRFTKKLNQVFGVVQFIQFCVSMIVTCITVHQLSIQKIPSAEFFMVVFLLGITLSEIFMFCWYGNEVILHSLDVSDAIYEVDWTAFSESSKKYLLMMMVCVSKPILISGGPIVTWNLDAFIKILKLSYSAVNVLQRTSQQSEEH